MAEDFVPTGPTERTKSWSTGTVRFRLAPRFRNTLIAAATTSAFAVAFLAVRANRSAAVMANYYDDYRTRGGGPKYGDVVKAVDRDKIAFVVVAFIAVAVWSVVVIVWGLRRARLRLDSEGLWWIPAHGLRWRGPIARDDFVAMQPGARKKATPILGMPLVSVGSAAAENVGIYDVTLLYLRSTDGFTMKRAEYMEIPLPPPEAANSLIPVPEALFTTNPEFRKTLLSWILS